MKIIIAVMGIMAMGLVIVGTLLMTKGDSASGVLIPTNAVEVEACFDLADAIHDQRGGESAYLVCSSNESAYEAWKEVQAGDATLYSDDVLREAAEATCAAVAEGRGIDSVRDYEPLAQSRQDQVIRVLGDAAVPWEDGTTTVDCSRLGGWEHLSFGIGT